MSGEGAPIGASSLSAAPLNRPAICHEAPLETIEAPSADVARAILDNYGMESLRPEPVEGGRARREGRRA
jgi:hypothetical protein